MFKRKQCEDINNIYKRQCLENQRDDLTELFGDLSDNIIIRILSNFDAVEFKKLELKHPIINIFKKFINFDNINLKAKLDLLIKTFKTNNLEIVKFVFDNIKYSNISNIFITPDYFEMIIRNCIINNFIDGIDFLVLWKENHWKKCKGYNWNNYYKSSIKNQYNLADYLELVKENYNQIKNNATNILNIFIFYMFRSNNVNLFEHIIKKYNNIFNSHYNVLGLMEDNYEYLFEYDNHLILEKYLSISDSDESVYEDMFNLCIDNTSLKCLEIVINKYQFNNTDIYSLIDDYHFECFDIVYKKYNKLFTKKRKDELILYFIYNQNIEAVKYLLNKFKRKIERSLAFLLSRNEFEFFNNFYDKNKKKLLTKKIINRIINKYYYVYEDNITTVNFLLEKFNKN